VTRAVPDGDEYDKDIACNSLCQQITKLINMSFGRLFTYEKHWVDDAVKYAESKDVLWCMRQVMKQQTLMKENYPNPFLKPSNTKAPNWLTVD